MGRLVWALFLEERDKIEGIWVDLSTRLVSDLQKSSMPVEGLSRGSSSMTLIIFIAFLQLGHIMKFTSLPANPYRKHHIESASLQNT